MSVRRLADESVQPEEFKFTSENDNWFEGELKKYPEGRQRSAIIPALMKAQEQEGWVTKRAIEHIAERLDMPYIRALEVATFYTQFMLSPVGTQAHVQVCGTTPCMLRGSEDLFAVCKSRIGPRPFAPNDAGTLSWEEVECQGACVNAPMVMIGKDTFEDLTPERLEEIIDAFDRGEGHTIQPGPQVDRHLSAPIGGRTTLLDYDEIEEHAHDEAPLDDRADTGEEDNVVPSEAARPDTHAQETDPAYADPSPDAPNVDPDAEDAASSDPDPQEKGIGASGQDGDQRDGKLSATTFGNEESAANPPLDQKAPADPHRAGEANEDFAERQASANADGTAMGGAQRSYSVQSVHRDDDRMADASNDTSVEDRATNAAASGSGMGTEADVEELQAQRNKRDAVGSDGVSAGEGAANDPKAIYGAQIAGHGHVQDDVKGAGTGKGNESSSVAGLGAGPDGVSSAAADTRAEADERTDGDGAGQDRPADTGEVTSPSGVAAPPQRDPRAAIDQSGQAVSRSNDGSDLEGEPDDVIAAAQEAPNAAESLNADPEGPAPATAHEAGPEREPDRLDAAREGGPDDLKLIWGVGPKLESMLHEMGFFHYDQIAGWSDEELNWVDRRLGSFRGRARRDKWTDQAERLAGGWRPDAGHGESPHQ